ncbi:WxL protein peptidoglycan domain-containing protein [Streptomyces sp. NPDC050085]|uniref:WxL protein peptidoglycan domain-containing protein n=1 Tax=Streptomyces sp. NPDC050085 TaxID=3365600 RepID=UPI0037983911
MPRHPRPLLRCAHTVLGAALFAVLAALLGAPPAAAADNGRWAVSPVASKLGQRPYFFLMADPGSTVTDKVVVANKSASALTFRLYAADAYNTVRDGGFAVRGPAEKQTGIGAWTTTKQPRITVPAHSARTVPFTLTVPAGAEPGDHPGALVALDERTQRAADSLSVGVRQAVGARIYLRVNGPTVTGLSVEDVRITHSQPLVPGTGSSLAVISYTLRNRGNVTLNPRVNLKATGLFGRTLLSRDLRALPTELLPHQKVRLSERWAKAPQADWGDVTLTATARDTEESGSASYFALPWLVASVLGAVVVAAVAWVLVRRRRRRGRAAAAPAAPRVRVNS